MNHTLNCKGKLLSLEHPLVMGILNVTEDSFYDGGRYFGDEKRGEKLGNGNKKLAKGNQGAGNDEGDDVYETEINNRERTLVVQLNYFPLFIFLNETNHVPLCIHG